MNIHSLMSKFRIHVFGELHHNNDVKENTSFESRNVLRQLERDAALHVAKRYARGNVHAQFGNLIVSRDDLLQGKSN